MTTPAHVGNKENTMSSKCKCGGYVGQYPDECLACWDRAKLCVSACAPLSGPTTSIPALLRVAYRLQEIAMSITTDEDQPCVICGDTYDVDHGKDDTGFCHQCATETLSELLGMLQYPVGEALPASDERGGA